MRIRKQVYDLTLEDIRRNAVWEFVFDEEGEEGQDEATVRPCDCSGTLDPSDRMFVVRAVFTLADGTLMLGYLTPPTQGEASLGALQPVIITDSGQVVFWHGVVAPKAEEMAESYGKLGRNAAEVFPVEVTSDVGLATGPIHASVSGFMVRLPRFDGQRIGQNRV